MSLFRKVVHKINHYSNPRLYLRQFFKFENWHISPFSNKKYCHLIVKELNNKSIKNSVVDLGCGLGDILSRLHYNNKLGIDIDVNVIKAATFLNFFKIFKSGTAKYICQNIFELDLEGSYDAIVIVNWIHNVDPLVLKKLFKNLYINNINNGGYLVFDIIENKDYKYNHNIEFLISSLGSDYRETGPFEYGRRIIFLKKNTHPDINKSSAQKYL